MTVKKREIKPGDMFVPIKHHGKIEYKYYVYNAEEDDFKRTFSEIPIVASVSIDDVLVAVRKWENPYPQNPRDPDPFLIGWVFMSRNNPRKFALIEGSRIFNDFSKVEPE